MKLANGFMWRLLRRSASPRSLRYLARSACTLALVAASALLLTSLLSANYVRQAAVQNRLAFSPNSVAATHDDAARTLLSQLNTRGNSLSLTPDSNYWILLDATLTDQGQHTVEIRHMRAHSAVFRAYRKDPHLGIVGVGEADLEWRHEKGGVVVDVPEIGSENGLLLVGKIDPFYPAVLKNFVWDSAAYRQTADSFNRIGGVLTGACTVLALTMGLLAWRNRDVVALLFGLTVILMLRVAAVNHGWDLYWSGWESRASLQAITLRMSLPLYAVVQGILFLKLFDTALKSVKTARLFPWVLAGFGALALASPWAPHDKFLKVFWIWAPIGAIHLTYLLIRVLPGTRDRAARLYALAVMITMLGMFAEIAYAAGIWTTTISTSLLGAVLGAALNSAAIAERMYQDRATAIASQGRELEALRKQELAFQENPVPLFEYSKHNVLKHSNVAFNTMFGIRPHDLADPSQIPWEDGFGPTIQFANLWARETHGTFEAVQLPSLGPQRYADVHWIRDQLTVRGSVIDVTEQVLARSALQRLVDHDQLTQTLNVRGLQSELSAVRSGFKEQNHCLVIFDIVRFDSINELFGREAGDAVLRTFASRLNTQIESPELLARLAADTFLILLPGKDTDRAMFRARELGQECIGGPIDYEGKAIVASVCIGVVPLTSDMSLEEGIGACQRILLRAKRQRTGAVSIAKEQDDTLAEYLREKALVGKLAGRLPVDQLYQVVQPIINLREPEGKFCAETLIRMRDSDGIEVPAAKFIPAAERNGMMSEIDRWMLEQTCIWLQENREKIPGLEYLTINTSGASLNDLKFHTDVRAILSEHSTISKYLCFEITESVALADPEWTHRFTDQLRSRGCSVALDDFGAGYTSFNYLKSIPAQTLKIDGAIVQSIANDVGANSILRAIRDLSADLGMRCVAEFASDYPIVRALRELEIDFGQGYALSKPILPEQLVGCQNGLALIPDLEVAGYLARTSGMRFNVGGKKARSTSSTKQRTRAIRSG